jgi:hypothetical protein
VLHLKSQPYSNDSTQANDVIVDSWPRSGSVNIDFLTSVWIRTAFAVHGLGIEDARALARALTEVCDEVERLEKEETDELYPAG